MALQVAAHNSYMRRLPLNSPKHPHFFSKLLNWSLPLSSRALALSRRRGAVEVQASSSTSSPQQARNTSAAEEWGKVSAVLFDMDGVLCNSEEASRMAAVDVFDEMGVSVTTEDFVPFMGTGEANFLGGVAAVKGVQGFDPEAAKKRFFEIYLDKYAKPNSGIGFPGALELVKECKAKGLKVAVASSADRIKVDANLAAAGLDSSLFDAIVSADAFENLKPAPDIFLAASKGLNVPTSECLVIEDALAGVQAAKAAQMRCIAVSTTLSEDLLQQASPSLIRRNIGDITINDIVNGGDTGYHNEKTPSPENVSSAEHTSSQLENGKANVEIVHNTKSSSKKVKSSWGLQGSRREILRYGSLGIAVSCLAFTITNWKAMQYASIKGIMNLFSGGSNPIFGQNEGDSTSRNQKLKSYLSDLESRGSTSIIPEFPSKLDWLNTSPLQFRKDLKGRVVLLDFWTYCCINCMHVLPDLDFLEKKYSAKPFTVVGVHSAKFDNEKDLEAIRNAVLRYNISHPVVNDGDMYLWRELGVNSWPTFVLVGPNGKILAQLTGEGRRKDLDDLIDAALQYYSEKKLLEINALPLALEKNKSRSSLASPLRFPGKLAVDILNNRLFISDSNHNRIVVTDLEGGFIAQVGSTGEEGLRDGNFDEACFSRPQGLAYNPKKNVLYVADTENHALRMIDFVKETVVTIAGNGTKGSDYAGGGKGTEQVLNSPWDVCHEPINEVVYIAMAGQHQIWEHNTRSGVTRAFSGNGLEKNLNGSSSTSTSFAQPSGISLSPDLQVIYVADSESSSIRVVDLITGGSKLLAGGDPLFADNLFRFGDHDGIGSDALFQHPLGVLYGKDKQIYVADSYNHKIKRLDTVSKKVTTLAGTGSAGFKDGPALSAQLSEPSGLVDAGNGRLFVADTNNNLIRYLDLNSSEPVLQTLELKGVQPLSKTKSLRRLRRRLSADTQVVKVDGGSSTEGYFRIAISVPEPYHFSKEARSKFDVETDPASAVNIEPSSGNLNSNGSAVLHFQRMSSSPVTGRVNCKVYYCKEDEACLYQSLAFDVSFQQGAPETNPSEIKLSYAVTPKEVPGGSLQLVLGGKTKP